MTNYSAIQKPFDQTMCPETKLIDMNIVRDWEFGDRLFGIYFAVGILSLYNAKTDTIYSTPKLSDISEFLCCSKRTLVRQAEGSNLFSNGLAIANPEEVSRLFNAKRDMVRINIKEVSVVAEKCGYRMIFFYIGLKCLAAKSIRHMRRAGSVVYKKSRKLKSLFGVDNLRRTFKQITNKLFEFGFVRKTRGGYIVGAAEVARRIIEEERVIESQSTRNIGVSTVCKNRVVQDDKRGSKRTGLRRFGCFEFDL